MKKIILTAFAGVSLLISGTPVFAELFSVSVGIPMSHTITGKTSSGAKTAESDGVSGSFVHAKLPLIPVGLGIESYKTKVKDSSPLKIATMMFDIFYLLPIPIINLTLGVGVGSTELQCDWCADTYDKGTANQWYASFGMPIIPLFDLHLSYRSVNTKIGIKPGSGGGEHDYSGNVMGLGIGFNF